MVPRRRSWVAGRLDLCVNCHRLSVDYFTFLVHCARLLHCETVSKHLHYTTKTQSVEPLVCYYQAAAAAATDTTTIALGVSQSP